MIGGENGRRTQWQYLLEHGLVRLRRSRSLPLRIQPATQRTPLLFGFVEPTRKVVALPHALLQLGAQPAATRKASHEVTEEDCEIAHVKAIIAPR